MARSLNNLKAALEEVQQYIELRSAPTRAERTFAGLTKLDPMIEALPANPDNESCVATRL